MSFDLIVWPGSRGPPSRHWSALDRGGGSGASPILPIAELVAALTHAFGDDIRIMPASGASAGVEVMGRGWECFVGGTTSTTISLGGEIVNEPAAIGAFVEAAHAAGCSVYDPQFGAYWPAAYGPPAAPEEAWNAAFFDEGFDYEDEDDEGHASNPKRLCPEVLSPGLRAVELYVHVDEPGPLIRSLVSIRAALHRERFAGWTIAVQIGGPGATKLDREDAKRWLKRARAKPKLAKPSRSSYRPSKAFAVLGDFDASRLADRFDVLPFELVPIHKEERELASIFDEPVAALFVVVRESVVVRAPEATRVALHALHRELLSCSEGTPLYFADPAQPGDAPIGANQAWVESLLGLARS